MGTHPIFESDFDCLTDPVGYESSKIGITSGNVRQCWNWWQRYCQKKEENCSQSFQHRRQETSISIEKALNQSYSRNRGSQYVQGRLLRHPLHKSKGPSFPTS